MAGQLGYAQGHRLKNADARITKCINGLETRRRVIITGTPIQVQ